MLLERAAYDTLNSMKAIDTAKICDIEAYLMEHRSTWIDDIRCCKSEEYKKQTTFHFLPGHKTILLAIPEQIKQMSGAKQTTKVSKKKDRSDEELKQNLISNLVNYMKNNQFMLPDGILSENNIREFVRASEIEDFVCKCRFVCPFCPKTFPLTFKTFWMSSNLTNHLKHHIQNEYFAACEEVEFDEEANVWILLFIEKSAIFYLIFKKIDSFEVNVFIETDFITYYLFT